jgi:hypothetical protein
MWEIATPWFGFMATHSFANIGIVISDAIQNLKVRYAVLPLWKLVGIAHGRGVLSGVQVVFANPE